MLETEYAVYKSRRAEFLKEHRGEFVIIVGNKVVGFYPSERAALEAMKGATLGKFFVKECVPTEDDVAEFHSRVAV